MLGVALLARLSAVARSPPTHADDPLVKRTLGLRRLPDVATLSRALAGADQESVKHLRAMLRELVLARLITLRLPRVTLDFDGSVIGTGRFAEGFNRKKKGQREQGAIAIWHCGRCMCPNDTKLFLEQREIPSKSAETTESRSFLEQLLADYGKTGLLAVISTDARMVSKEHADCIGTPIMPAMVNGSMICAQRMRVNATKS